MTKFKIGDRVKDISNSSLSTGSINAMRENEVQIFWDDEKDLKLDPNENSFWSEDDFELIEEAIVDVARPNSLFETVTVPVRGWHGQLFVDGLTYSGSAVKISFKEECHASSMTSKQLRAMANTLNELADYMDS